MKIEKKDLERERERERKGKKSTLSQVLPNTRLTYKT
jgi:hypothetical protein